MSPFDTRELVSFPNLSFGLFLPTRPTHFVRNLVVAPAMFRLYSLAIGLVLFLSPPAVLAAMAAHLAVYIAFPGRPSFTYCLFCIHTYASRIQ